MKFITKNDMHLTIHECLLDQIIQNDTLLDMAEDRAISVCDNYLRAKYDMDYEFRTIQTFEINKDYEDYSRIKLEYNEDHNNFGTSWNIDLLDNNTTAGMSELLVKIKNSCETETEQKWTNNSMQHASPYMGTGDQFDRTRPIPTNGGYSIDNEDYNESCGVIICSDGTIKSDKILNYYNSDYTTSGIQTVDYSQLTTTEAQSILFNNDYFDQYILENKSRDFKADDRNPTLIRVVIDLMLNELLATVSPTDYNETYSNRYQSSMQMLDDVARGRATMSLKEYDFGVAQQTQQGFRWGQSFSDYKNKY